MRENVRKPDMNRRQKKKGHKVFLPSKEKCMALFHKVQAPQHLIEHSSRVAEVAEKIALAISEKGEKINAHKLWVAGMLHDVARHMEGNNQPSEKIHEKIGQRLIKKNAEFLGINKNSADKIGKTAIHLESTKEQFMKMSLEKAIVLYADARAKGNQIVSLEERRQDVWERYPKAREKYSVMYPFLHEFEEKIERQYGLNLRELIRK